MPDRRIYQPVPTTQGDEEKSPAPRRERGRPKGGIADRLFALLTQDGAYGTFTDSNTLWAAELHTTIRNIQYGLAQLEQRCAIERKMVDGQRLIILTPDGPHERKSDALIDAELAPEPQQDAGNSATDSTTDAAHREATRVPPLPPLSRETASCDNTVIVEEVVMPSLADAVYEAYCTYRSERTARRGRLVVYHVMTNYPGLATEEEITACYRDGMALKRRWLIECDLRELAPHELKAIKSTGAAIVMQGAKANRSSVPNKQQKLGKFIQERVERECKRRGITLRQQRKQVATQPPLLASLVEEVPPTVARGPDADAVRRLIADLWEVRPGFELGPLVKFHDETPASELGRIATQLQAIIRQHERRQAA